MKTYFDGPEHLVYFAGENNNWPEVVKSLGTSIFKDPNLPKSVASIGNNLKEISSPEGLSKQRQELYAKIQTEAGKLNKDIVGNLLRGLENMVSSPMSNTSVEYVKNFLNQKAKTILEKLPNYESKKEFYDKIVKVLSTKLTVDDPAVSIIQAELIKITPNEFEPPKELVTGIKEIFKNNDLVSNDAELAQFCLLLNQNINSAQLKIGYLNTTFSSISATSELISGSLIFSEPDDQTSNLSFRYRRIPPIGMVINNEKKV